MSQATFAREVPLLLSSLRFARLYTTTSGLALAIRWITSRSGVTSLGISTIIYQSTEKPCASGSSFNLKAEIFSSACFSSWCSLITGKRFFPKERLTDLKSPLQRHPSLWHLQVPNWQTQHLLGRWRTSRAVHVV